MILRMLVALDVGNTNIKYSMVDGGQSVASGHVPTPRDNIPVAIDRWLAELIDPASSGAATHIELAMVSVVPAIADAIDEFAARRGFPVLVADRSTIPIAIRVDQPQFVGDDRLVNAYAALRLHGAPAIVVDLGTATTFDAVNADGEFIGGAIAAGAGLALEALTRGTAQLPRVPLVMPPHAIGRDTITAMQSGAVIGHSGLVLVMVRAISDELTAEGGPKPRVILTGGLSTSDWAQAIPALDVIDPYLTLEGLVRLQGEARQAAGARP
jgi:type III pantothenate kinase